MATVKQNVFGLDKYYQLIVDGCISDETGSTLWAWGGNINGQLGDNTTVCRSSPVQVPGTTWKDATVDLSHSLGLKTDGTLWAWGIDCFGSTAQNGGIFARYSSPIQIPGTTWASMSKSNAAWNPPESAGFIATKSDNTLWSWGNNDYGNLGQNDRVDRSSPVQIPGTTWSHLNQNNKNGGLKTDGTLWSWGYNCDGQLGQNNRTSYSSPVQIPGTNWCALKISRNTFGSPAIGLKTNGTLWAWGDNCFASIDGVGTILAYSSPIQIPGTTWTNADSEAGIILATKSDNTLWVWGTNCFGALALNDRVHRSSPVQVPGTTWCSAMISTGGNAQFTRSSFAGKTDGTLWAWGSSCCGVLGLNNLTIYSSPVQIPGTNWISVCYSTNYATFGLKCPL